MADLGSKKIGNNYQKLLQISSSGEIADASGSGFGIFIGDRNGSISGNHITASGDISASGDILLDEDQRIYFEADKQTWMEANGANLVRIVTNNSQMLLLDHETGNRAVFGNGTKVYIGENNNALPSNTLEVDGNISASAAISASTGIFHNLPTSDPGLIGHLFTTGSSSSDLGGITGSGCQLVMVSQG